MLEPLDQHWILYAQELALIPIFIESFPRVITPTSFPSEPEDSSHLDHSLTICFESRVCCNVTATLVQKQRLLDTHNRKSVALCNGKSM